jgi:hypothetical protein
MLTRKIKRLKNIFVNRAIVLCYHRIASVDYDPWTLAVSEKNFEQHLEIFSKNYRVVLQKICFIFLITCLGQSQYA